VVEVDRVVEQSLVVEGVGGGDCSMAGGSVYGGTERLITALLACARAVERRRKEGRE
jgi:glutamate/tyrosine decarboxylase-like PLP-dependent enzyme